MKSLIIGLALLHATSAPAADTTLTLDLQRRDPKTDAVSITHQKVTAARTAIIVVDMWDYHWCATWFGRAGAMIPRMNHALAAARKLGMTVIFAPTDCVAGHAGTPARERMTAVAKHALPNPIAFDPPAPWSFGLGSGCMCGGPFPCEVNYDNSAQDKRLIIAEGDYISAGLEEVHNLCKEKGISHLLYMGGATNMCLCQKPEGMIGMTRYGYSCALCRDCTEAHGPNTGSEHADRNTAFSVAYIEKHIGPSIDFAAELRKLGKWEDTAIDPVLIAPWGFKNRPKLFEDSLAVSLSMPHVAGATIRYTLDGSVPTLTSTGYEKPIAITRTTTLRAQAFKADKRIGLESDGYYAKLGPVPPIPDVFASDLRPTKMSLAGWTDLYEQGPAVPGPQMDKSYLKEDLRLRGRNYKKGIGVKAPANLVFEVKPEYGAFVAQAGVDESCLRIDLGRGRANFPSVVFAVFVDGKQAATSPVMRISQEPWRCQVPLPKGAKTISLAVTDAGDGGREDFSHWVNTGFVVRPENRPPPLHAAVGKAVTLANPSSPHYSQGGPAILTDGLAHAIHQRRGCLGFEGTDMDATIDLGEPTAIRSVGASFLQDTAGGIYLPTKVEFSVSDDGKAFHPIGTATHNVAISEAGPLTRTLRTNVSKSARYVRAVAKSVGTIPVSQPAAGAKAWLFVDEVMVNLKEEGKR